MSNVDERLERSIRVDAEGRVSGTVHFTREEVEALATDSRRRPTRAATSANVARGERHARQAAALREAGMSVAQIANKMARDDGRDEAYPVRTVNRWLAAAKKG